MSTIQKTENPAEIRSKQVIRIGFTLVMLVIFFIVSFGIYRLRIVNDSVEEIVGHEQVAIEMLFHMQQYARERSVLLFVVASTQDPFERDEMVLKHGRLGGQFALARQKLSALQLDKDELGLLEKLNGHVDIASGMQRQVVDLLSAGHILQAREILNKQAVPAQDKILDLINALLDYELGKSNESKQLLQKQQLQTRVLLIASWLIAALLVALIASFVNRRMGKLITNLELSAHQIKEANRSLELLRTAMDQHDIVSIADVQGNITFVNEKFCQISQYTFEELIGQNHRILKSGMHPQAFYEDMWLTISSGKIWQSELCNRTKSGGQYWVYSTIVPFLDEFGLPYQYISVRTDITATKQAEQLLLRGNEELEKLVHERTADLEEREEVLRSITMAAQDAVIMIDSNGDVTHWNPAAEKMFGYSAVEIIGKNLHSLIVPSRYLDAHLAAFPKFIQSGTGSFIGKVIEVDAQNRNGEEFPVELAISAVNVKSKWHAVALVRDITARRIADENLKQMATTDALTGAYNRRYFNEMMQIEIARTKRYGSPLAVIMFDIDHFKRINDTFGHPTGDQVLLKLTLLVSANIRDTDILARWGGEEFVILATNCDIDGIQIFAEKLRKLIEAYPFNEIGNITCSFGVAEYRAGDEDETIIKRADMGLYAAKGAGRNRVCHQEEA